MTRPEQLNAPQPHHEIAPPNALEFAKIGMFLGIVNLVLVVVAVLYAIGSLTSGSQADELFAREALRGTLFKFHLAIIAFYGFNAIVSIGLLFACGGVQDGSQSSPRRMVFFSIWLLLLQVVGVKSLTGLALWWRSELSANDGGRAGLPSLQELAGFGGGILGIVMALALLQSLYYILAIRYFSRRDVRECFDPDVVMAEMVEK